MSIKVGIVGGTGYTGVELLRLLARHPQAELRAITSRKEAGTPVAAMFPSLRKHVDLAFTAPDAKALGGCDVVFFATPNGVAMNDAREILVSGLREYLAGLNVRVEVTRLAKWKTTLQLVAVGFLVLGDAGDAILPVVTLIGLTLLWLSALLTLYTGWDYFRAGLRHLID